jgi:copper chaperone CopZ
VAASDVTLHAEGLQCVGCAAGAEETLRRIEGVESAMADYLTSRIRVRFDDARVGERQLEAALEGIGVCAHETRGGDGDGRDARPDAGG